MKKLFYLLTLAAFVFSVTMAVAQGSGQPTATPAKPGGEAAVKSIHCCVKGDCKSVANEADCAKQGGKVVKDCKECK